MAKVLCIDPIAGGLSFCLRAIAMGHEVKWYISPSHSKYNKGERSSVGDGLVERVDSWRAHMKWADLIFTTFNTEPAMMKAMDDYKDKGYPVFGPDARGTKLEIDRMYGQQVIKDFGGAIIPSIPFKDFGKAIEFIKANPQRYVSKPVGEEEDKSLSYVSKSAADMIATMSKWQRMGKQANFILQEFKPGIEFAACGIFGPGGFSQYWEENFEFKKLMNDDLGPNTGEQGTVMKYTLNSKLCDMLIKPMEEVLHKINYVGFMDINCIIDEKDGTPWPMEWTARPGWPAYQLSEALFDCDPVEAMIDCINGYDTFKMKLDHCVGVVISNGDYPFFFKPTKEMQDYPVTLNEPKYIKNIHPSDVKLGTTSKMEGDKIVEEVPEWVTAGSYIATCTGLGKSITEAKDEAYKVIKSIELGNDSSYRTDIGASLEKSLPKLKKFGYCTDWRF